MWNGPDYGHDTGSSNIDVTLNDTQTNNYSLCNIAAGGSSSITVKAIAELFLNLRLYDFYENMGGKVNLS